MKKEILDVISKGGVSFVELTREVPGFEGDYQLINNKNWVYWAGLSEEAAHALLELENDNVIYKKPCQQLIYFVDGGGLRLPLVKSDITYKKPRWMPVVYSLVKSN